MGANLNIKELGVPTPRVCGSAAKMSFLRYKLRKPNIGLELTLGQLLTSCDSMADHCFISSEMGTSLGRFEGLAFICKLRSFLCVSCILRGKRQSFLTTKGTHSAPLRAGCGTRRQKKFTTPKKSLKMADSGRQAHALTFTSRSFADSSGICGSVMRCGSRISAISFSLSNPLLRAISIIDLPVATDSLTISAALAYPM